MSSSEPVSARLRMTHHPCLKLGALVGACLAVIGAAWVLIANDAPSLQRFASARDLTAALAFGALMLVPLFSFAKAPARIFLSGIIGWAVFTIAYGAMEASFPQPEDRLGAFHLFMIGAVIFGLMASVAWVALMIFLARQHHHQAVVVARRRLP
jgi:hypothetical protein